MCTRKRSRLFIKVLENFVYKQHYELTRKDRINSKKKSIIGKSHSDSCFHFNTYWLTLLAGLRIYWDCNSCQRIRTRPKRRSVLSITLNCIHWWGSSSGTLRSTKSSLCYHYSQVHSDLKWSYHVVNWKKKNVVVPVGVPSMGQIDLFANYLYSIEISWNHRSVQTNEYYY